MSGDRQVCTLKGGEKWFAENRKVLDFVPKQLGRSLRTGADEKDCVA